MTTEIEALAGELANARARLGDEEYARRVAELRATWDADEREAERKRQEDRLRDPLTERLCCRQSWG
jgi:hypothetical protein